MTTANPPDAIDNPDPLEARPQLALEAQTHAEVDVQITTARRYPRSVRRFLEHAQEMAILDENVAASCFYALPRDGKTIDGPSARLAEICASAWGHMRVQARIVDEDDRFITARGECWDVETNVAIAFDVRRRITDKKGRRYSDDMVSVTGNAASSIALRNAIFKVIPSAFWRPIYLKCREVAVGKAETLANKRAAMLAYFQKMGATEDRVLATIGVRGVEDIGLEQLGVLRGLATAIKDGDTSVDEAFPAAPASVLPMPQRLSEQQPTPPNMAVDRPYSPAQAPTSIPPITSPWGEQGLLTDRLVDVNQVGNGFAVCTEGGLRLWTRDAALGAQLVAAKGEVRRFTADPPDAQGRRKLTTLEA